MLLHSTLCYSTFLLYAFNTFIYLSRSDKIQFMNSSRFRNWTLYYVGRPYYLRQKSGQKASVVDFLTYSMGQKSGQKASVVDLPTCSLGQKSGQKATVAQCWFFPPKLCIFWILTNIQIASRKLNKVSFDRYFNGASEICNYFTHFLGIGPQFWILVCNFISKLQNWTFQLPVNSFKLKSGF